MNWQRARTDETKNERKKAIHEAALELFKNNGYDKVSFNGIASEAGFTKSNMYRYFSSKEEIFLSIFSDLFKDWVNDCTEMLRNLDTNVAMSTFANSWVKSHNNHHQFLDLTTILFVSLERNSSYEQLVIFKRLAKNLLSEIALEIIRIYPDFRMDDAFSFLNLSFAATSSFWAGSTQNESLTKIYQQEEFKALEMNFDKDLTHSIEIIIRGIKTQN